MGLAWAFEHFLDLDVVNNQGMTHVPPRSHNTKN